MKHISMVQAELAPTETLMASSQACAAQSFLALTPKRAGNQASVACTSSALAG